MTLSVITGTLSNEFEFRDPWGEFEKLVSQGYFIKQYWTGTRWLPSTKKKVYTWNGKRGQIIQTTGSGKTILEAIMAWEAHQHGTKTGGNLNLGWTENNIGKPKSQWKPVITSMAALQKAVCMDISLDDIRAVISSWNTKDADMVAETANATRKRKNKIKISTQRMKYVPPDMRDIIDEVYVPFIRAYDTTRYAPDGRWSPVELLCLHFSSGYEFLDAKIYNLTTPTARYVLDSFDTLQIAESLGEGDASMQTPTKRPGEELEIQLTIALNTKIPSIDWIHHGVDGREFDTEGDPFFLVDFVKWQPSTSNLETSEKNWSNKCDVAQELDKIPLLVWEQNKNIYFAVIKKDFPYRQDISTASKFMQRRARRIETLTTLYNHLFSQLETLDTPPQTPPYTPPVITPLISSD